MGFDKNGVRLLLHTKKQGINFSKTMTIGRQGLHLSDTSLAENLREFGYPLHCISSIRGIPGGFAENFLRLMGAWQPESIDASNYEQATHLHDMNIPIPDGLKNRYSVVLDGGSLEHVFNFPVAIKNCMEMVQTGGHFIAITPCNNNMGHGFYQFSPELFYRVFSLENGFLVREMIFYTDAPKANWYTVPDPEAVKSRVCLQNSYSAYLCVVAQKIADKEIFEITPQQSDYLANWSAANSETQKLTSQYTGSSSLPTILAGLRWRILQIAYQFKIAKTILKDTGTGKVSFFKVKNPKTGI